MTPPPPTLPPEERELIAKLNELVIALSVRGVGHTQVMRRGTDASDCIVIAHTAQYAREIGGRRGIALDEMTDKLRGQRKPIAIDHHALQILLGKTLLLVGRLRSDLARANDEAYERAAVACFEEAERLQNESKAARQRGADVTANLLAGKRDTADACKLSVRALKGSKHG